MFYGLVPLPSLTHEEPFCTCVVRLYSSGGLLDLKNEKYVVSLSFIQAGPSSSLFLPLLYLEVSAHSEQIPAAQPGTHLSPALGSQNPEENFAEKLCQILQK